MCAALDHAQFIPAAAVASGAEGAFYQTDMDLSNAGGQPVEYQLMWLPRGEDNSEPMTSENFSLGAGMSVRYANVLSEVFDLEPNSLGALALVSTSADLLAMSRTYNTPSGEPAGTYGQAMPAVAPDGLHPVRRAAADPVRERERRSAHQRGLPERHRLDHGYQTRAVRHGGHPTRDRDDGSAGLWQ